MSKIYFQIGTNNGNDRFRQLVKTEKPDMVILVEPNESLLNEIKSNYEEIENVNIYNNAVYHTDDEPIELYIPKKDGYSNGHFSLLPMNDWGKKEDMVKIQTKSITFDKICSNHNITNIEYLQIDTEGFDSEIIKMLDLSKYKINNIRFETWGFPIDCFTKYHNELSNELGINGMNNSINKLKQYNYTLNYINDEDGNDIIASLV